MQSRHLISWLTSSGPLLAVVLSFFAVLISAFSLGWNVYRDVILKPRLKVRFSWSRLLSTVGPRGSPFLQLSIVNHGPGDAICGMPVIRNKHWVRRILGESATATLVHDFTNPICAKPPFKLAVAEEAQVTFPITNKTFLDEPIFGIGIKDSFGRVHWAPRKDIRKARKDLQEFRRLENQKETRE
jgi:hypothetical protein